MRKPVYKFLAIIFLAGLMIACTKDFVVKNIKKSHVNIIAPADGMSTPNNTVIFWWDELDGAEEYELQIVSPDFSAVQQLVVDTVLSGNKFTHTFVPGSYQWRIRATNAGGSTDYTTRSFVIDTTSNLNLVSVSLIAPHTPTVTSATSIAFSWNPLPAASYYELTVTSLSTGSVTTVSNITATGYNLSFSVASGAEESFAWKVRAFNSFSQTQNNTVRTFKIDKLSPLAPIILAPVNSSIVRDTSKIRWNHNPSPNDIEKDIVSISSDSLFANVINTTTVTAANQVPISALHTYTGTAQPYWIKIVSVDSVKNQSNPAVTKRFYIQ